MHLNSPARAFVVLTVCFSWCALPAFLLSAESKSTKTTTAPAQPAAPATVKLNEPSSPLLDPHAKSYQDALIAFKSGKWADAKKAAEESNGLKPNDPKTLTLLGRIALAEKKHDEAESFLNAALAKAGSDTTPRLYIGDLLREKRDFSGARASYEKYLETHAKDPDALLKLVYCYLGSKDSDSAQRIALSMDAFSQLHPGYYFARAAISEVQGNKDQANKLLGSAQTIYGDAFYLVYLKEYLQALRP